MAVENAEIVGEAKEVHSNPQVDESVYEKKARAKNWVPLEEWRGSVEDWVPAKEFVQRQKLFDRIDSLKESNKKLKDEFDADMKVISKHLAQSNEMAYKRALDDLKAQRALAIEDRNADAVEAIDEKIDEAKKGLAEVEVLKKEKPKAPQESEQFVEWRKENSWFDTDSEMRDDAIAIGVGYAAKNQGKTEEQVYEYVTSKIQKMHPEKFQKEKKETVSEEKQEEETKPIKKNTNAVEGGGSRVNNQQGRGKNKITVADLDEQTRSVMKTLIKRNALKELADKNKVTQEEQFLNDYQSRIGTFVR